MARLTIVPITLAEANDFVEIWHRHHGRVCGAKFCIGAALAGELVGVAIVGRPVARQLDDGWTLEVCRTCTKGTFNANSLLYAAAWRAARSLGYRRLITYTLNTEQGSSLKGAGWRCVGKAGGGTWNRDQRPRVDHHPLQAKLRWEAVA